MKKLSLIASVLLMLGCMQNAQSEATVTEAAPAAPAVVADTADKNIDDFAAVRDLFEQNLQIQIASVANSGIPNLLEVSTNQGIFYVTENASHILHGTLFSVNNGIINETEKALEGLRVSGLAKLAGSSLDYPAKDEKYRITVFTDVTCGYCRMLHQHINEYNDLGISVHYMAFPRAGLNSKSARDLKSIWCSDNPQQALTDAKSDKPIPVKTCDNKVEEQFEFAQSVGVNSTPAIITESGKLIPGYRPPQAMLQTLQQVAQ